MKSISKYCKRYTLLKILHRWSKIQRWPGDLGCILDYGEAGGGGGGGSACWAARSSRTRQSRRWKQSRRGTSASPLGHLLPGFSQHAGRLPRAATWVMRSPQAPARQRQLQATSTHRPGRATQPGLRLRVFHCPAIDNKNNILYTVCFKELVSMCIGFQIIKKYKNIKSMYLDRVINRSEFSNNILSSLPGTILHMQQMLHKCTSRTPQELFNNS